MLQVLALWWRGDCLCGVLEVLQTPGGRRVRDTYAAGALLGASVHAVDVAGKRAWQAPSVRGPENH